MEDNMIVWKITLGRQHGRGVAFLQPLSLARQDFNTHRRQQCYRGREHGAGPACGEVAASSELWWARVVLAHGVVR